MNLEDFASKDPALSSASVNQAVGLASRVSQADKALKSLSESQKAWNKLIFPQSTITALSSLSATNSLLSKQLMTLKLQGMVPGLFNSSLASSSVLKSATDMAASWAKVLPDYPGASQIGSMAALTPSLSKSAFGQGAARFDVSGLGAPATAMAKLLVKSSVMGTPKSSPITALAGLLAGQKTFRDIDLMKGSIAATGMLNSVTAASSALRSAMSVVNPSLGKNLVLASTGLSGLFPKSWTLPSTTFSGLGSKTPSFISAMLPALSAATRLASMSTAATSLSKAISAFQGNESFLKQITSFTTTGTGYAGIVGGALASTKTWQSAQLSSLLRRLTDDDAFRDSLIERLKAKTPIEEAPITDGLTKEELLTTVEKGIEESGIGDLSVGSTQLIQRLEKWLERVPPQTRQIIIPFLLTIVVNALTLAIEYGFLQNSEPQIHFNRTQVKIVQKVAREALSHSTSTSHLLGLIRVVNKDSLRITKSKGRDAERVGLIHAGQVVVVHRKERNWCLVMWRDPKSGETMSGWTLTRYLKRI